MLIREKTPERISIQVNRIARRARDKPEFLLRAFNGVRAGEPREPLISLLGECRYQPAAKPIFEYAKTTTDHSEIAASILALNRLGYWEARDFVERTFQQISRWYYVERDYLQKKGVAEAKELMEVSGRFMANF